jgi:hypothetical protein
LQEKCMDLKLDPSNVVSDLSEQASPKWPAEVLPLFQRAITTEYASLTARGAPLTYPVTPYVAEDGRTLDISTGLTYPSKAERARRNPNVALLFSDPVGTGLSKPPVALVQGLAAVRDADLQANTDRYLALSFNKLPEAYSGMPRFFLRRLQWYFVRIWIQITPLRILWWPEGNLDRTPERWETTAGVQLPVSDPPPPGKSPGSWKEGPADWRIGARVALQRLGNPVLTLVDKLGYPLPMRVRNAQLTDTGFRVELPAGLPACNPGPACLTFHTHPEQFTGQQNMVFTGRVEASGLFIVDRQIGDWSLAGSKLQATWDFMSNGRKLAPRLQEEVRRRGQVIPVIHLPVK